MNPEEATALIEAFNTLTGAGTKALYIWLARELVQDACILTVLVLAGRGIYKVAEKFGTGEWE